MEIVFTVFVIAFGLGFLVGMTIDSCESESEKSQSRWRKFTHTCPRCKRHEVSYYDYGEFQKDKWCFSCDDLRYM